MVHSDFGRKYFGSILILSKLLWAALKIKAKHGAFFGTVNSGFENNNRAQEQDFNRVRL